MIKAVVFDLDDTLISEKEYIRSGFREVSDKINNDFGVNSEEVYEVLYSEFEVDSKNVFNRSLDRFNIEYDNQYVISLVNTYREHKPKITLYDDAKYIIEKLYGEGIKLGIITDGYSITQRNKLETLNIELYFNNVVVTDELGKEYWKPHKKPYELMREKLDTEYENMIYIGDNVQKDFVTAKKLGIHTILINRNDGVYSNIQVSKEYEPKMEIMNLREVSKILDSFGRELNEENTICNYCK